MKTIKQQIINKLSEVESWNNGDLDVCQDPRFDGNVSLDLKCTKARKKVIKELFQLVDQIKQS